MARAQGWRPVLGQRRHRSHPRSCWHSDRFCQGYARPDRAASGGRSIEGERGAVSSARRKRNRLRNLHAGPCGHHHQLERGGCTLQGLYSRRNPGSEFLPLLLRSRSHGGHPLPRFGDRGTRGPFRSRRVAHPQGWLALLGQRRHRRHPQPDGRATRFREDYARPH